MHSSQSSSPLDSERNPSKPERRLAPRANTELSVLIGDGVLVSWARCVDISTGGLLLARDRAARGNDWRIYLRLELELPGEHAAINAVARPVWSSGPYQALTFVRMSDADRLRLAEHVDRCARADVAQ
jgi:hypothetical protein